MPNVVKIVKGIKKAVGNKKSTAATKKGLKAAQGPAKYPKGYKTEAERRAATLRRKQIESKPSKLQSVLEMQEIGTLSGTIRNPAPKNIISRSGRKANTPRMLKKAAKKGK